MCQLFFTLFEAEVPILELLAGRLLRPQANREIRGIIQRADW